MYISIAILHNCVARGQIALYCEQLSDRIGEYDKIRVSPTGVTPRGELQNPGFRAGTDLFGNAIYFFATIVYIEI